MLSCPVPSFRTPTRAPRTSCGACTGSPENVALNPWLDSESQTFDAELVLWSDQLFPQPDDESACRQTFQRYVNLAEKIRSLSQGSECVISASETGDPRDDRGKQWTCWWSRAV